MPTRCEELCASSFIVADYFWIPSVQIDDSSSECGREDFVNATRLCNCKEDQ
ncbi:hypothetical protein J6590_049397 [Homalodisca vitripennis]|nr:hypothetical protein J6590_049397 [Homalodisca vitripennis]